MMQNNDTIAAIATPVGQGGIGIIRLSGPASLSILETVFKSSSASFSGFKPWVLHHGHAVDADGSSIDDVLAVSMPAPRTFTGEDVAEIHCHGGPAILAGILERVFALGARPADAGEFSRRAFLNGRMDLTQAEAVAEMIAAPARGGMHLAQARLDGLLGKRIAELRAILDGLRMQLCVAVDFPEEELECLSPQQMDEGIDTVVAALERLLGNYASTRCWREGVLVVLAGQVNAGKSSLMNALLGRKRAIVTDVPGTTRDFLEEHLNFDGLPVRLVDTAGLRETGDIVEQEGVRMSRDLASQADLVLLVVDATRGPEQAERELVAQVGPEKVLVVLNKADLVETKSVEVTIEGCEQVFIAAKHGEGLEQLVQHIRRAVLSRSGGHREPESGDVAPNLRQSRAMERALDELRALKEDIAMQVPYDLLGVRFEAAGHILAEITGETTPDDILNAIFDDFCIGK